MGSLRNPVGPLPSSIYWRRRAVALSLIAVLVLLVVWAVNSTDPGGGEGAGRSDNGKGPAASITPGPSSTGPAISERPGGRDESGSGSASGGGGTAGTGGGHGGGTGGGSGGAGAPAAGTGGANGSGGGTGGAAAGADVPDCSSEAVTLTLRSVKDEYAPGEKPTFELVAKNASGTTCKVDFSGKSTVLTVKRTDAGGQRVWGTDDCPRDRGALLLQVPANGETKRTVEWDRKGGAPQCGTPPAAGEMPPGTYLAELASPGLPDQQVSFVLRAA
ncbi:hypothetical protein [Streptomyces sp. URMC 123]|uniref:hypothetical protein n=1 Tax=Streptomyces sp. URMC 123 TaxID=3423403 RepID=UPI003F1BEA7B